MYKLTVKTMENESKIESRGVIGGSYLVKTWLSNMTEIHYNSAFVCDAKISFRLMAVKICEE